MMRAPISVVIPTLDAAASLPRALSALGEGLSEGLIRELIVSDGGSTDDTREIATEAGGIWTEGPPGRGGQLRRGAELAEGEWLLFLHADTVLQPGWAQAVMAHLVDGRPACFRLGFDAAGAAPRLVAGWANLRSRAFRLPYGDQGLLVRREDYAAAGGYPEQPLMEDVALVRRLGRVRVLDGLAVTSAERYRRQGWLRRGGRNLWTLTRYFAGVSPETLARDYRR